MDMDIGNKSLKNKSHPLEDVLEEDWSLFGGISTTVIPMVLILNLLKLIIVIFVVLANILLILAILYYSKLRTRVNNYILNYAITNLLYMLSAPLFFLLNDFTGIFSIHFYCLAYELELVTLLWNFFFIVALLLDFYLSKYDYANFLLIDRIYHYVKYGVYIVGFLFLTVSGGFCLSDVHITIHTYSVIAAFFLSFITLLVVDVKYHLNSINHTSTANCSNSHLLFICNYTIISFLPILFFHIFYVTSIWNYEYDTMVALWCIEILSECINYTPTLVLIYTLFKFDKDFKVIVLDNWAKICCKSRDTENDLENCERSASAFNYVDLYRT